MGAANGGNTVGSFMSSASSLNLWKDGQTDLEAHGYKVVKELSVASNAAVCVVRRTAWPEQHFVVKAFAVCSASELATADSSPLQEVMLLRSLQHDYIVKYQEAWWTDVQVKPGSQKGRLSLVMEYAEDGDLHTPRLAMVHSGRHIQEAVLARWLNQLLQALAYIHNLGIVHRDLKTSNVFLKDSWRSVLLGDFGISAVLARTTFTKTCAGTPAYMSPEAVRSERYTTAVDIWAVGVILYELMVLQLPFSGSLLTMIYQIAFGQLKEISLRDAGYSEVLVNLVIKLLAKDATARPTARDLLDNDSFWTSCPFTDSEGLASAACFEHHREKLLKMPRTFSDGSTEVGTTGTNIPVCKSWDDSTWSSVQASSVNTGANSAAQSLWFFEENEVTRGDDTFEVAATSGMDFPSGFQMNDCATTMPYTSEAQPASGTDADEALRNELCAAHERVLQGGSPISPDQLADLLARHGAADALAMTS